MLQASKQLKRDWKLARLCVGERICDCTRAGCFVSVHSTWVSASSWVVSKCEPSNSKAVILQLCLGCASLGEQYWGKKCICIYTYTYIYVYIHIYFFCTYTYICMYTCMYVCVCVFLYLRMPKADPREGNAEPWGIVRPKVSQRTTNTVRLSWFLFPHC